VTSSVIALAADHAGYELKNRMKAVLEEHGFPLVDLGPETADPIDYPDMAAELAAALGENRAEQGLLVCGHRHRHCDRGQPLPLDPGRRVIRRHRGASGARAQ
jgi:Ribose/Galactose Isomerase